MRPAGLCRRRRLEMGQRNRLRAHHRLARLGREFGRHRRFGHGPVALARRLVGTVAIVDHHRTRGLRPGCRLESHPGLRPGCAGLTCSTAAPSPPAASATTPATAALGALTLCFACGSRRAVLARRAQRCFRTMHRLIAWLDIGAGGGAALGATLRAAFRAAIAIAPALVTTAVTATVPTAIAVVAIAIPTTVATSVTPITPGALCIT